MKKFVESPAIPIICIMSIVIFLVFYIIWQSYDKDCKVILETKTSFLVVDLYYDRPYKRIFKEIK